MRSHKADDASRSPIFRGANKRSMPANSTGCRVRAKSRRNNRVSSGTSSSNSSSAVLGIGEASEPEPGDEEVSLECEAGTTREEASEVLIGSMAVLLLEVVASVLSS